MRQKLSLHVILVVIILLCITSLSFANDTKITKVFNATFQNSSEAETILFQMSGASQPVVQRDENTNTLLLKFNETLPSSSVKSFVPEGSEFIKGVSFRMESEENKSVFVCAIEVTKWVPYHTALDKKGQFVLEFLKNSPLGQPVSITDEDIKKESKEEVSSMVKKGSDNTPAEKPAEPAPATSEAALFWRPEANVPLPETKKEQYQEQILEEKMFNQLITLDLKDAPMQNVIRLIASKTGLNVIMNKDQVKGTVTVHLENVKLGVALESILKTNDLSFVRESGGIVRIVPRSEVRGRETIETKTVNIPINWLPASKVAETITPFVSISGKVKASEESNSVIITDVPPKVEEIRKLINEIDVPEKQVLIESRLLDITEEAGKKLGISWSISEPDSSLNSLTTMDRTLNTFSRSVTTISYPDLGSNDPAAKITQVFFKPTVDTINWTEPVDQLGVALPVNTGGKGATWAVGGKWHIFGSDMDVEAQIQALEEKKLVSVLANPRISTLNNIPAHVEIVKNWPYTEAVQGPGLDSTTQEVQFKQSGITLDVTPNITNNGFVRMKIEPVQHIFRGYAGRSDVPLIDDRSWRANVIVKDEETIALGGLRQIENSNDTSGVPWLMHLPVFGWLFKSKAIQDDKLELVLFVTPHIIKEEPKLTDKEIKDYNSIDYNWSLPDEQMDELQMRDKDKGNLMPPRGPKSVEEPEKKQ